MRPLALNGSQRGSHRHGVKRWGRAMPRVNGRLVAMFLTVAVPCEARASESTARTDSASAGLAFYAGAGVLGSPGAVGSDVAFGLRMRAASHLALNLDTAYGLVAASGVAQDRWWAIPAIAAVAPLGSTTLDVGAGMGVGTTSGYASWSAYAAAPLEPTWHHTVPAAQLHVSFSIPLEHIDLMARAQAGTLLGVAKLAPADGTWLGLTLGIQARVL
ncbi:MAG: hypothetical protein JST54_11365 [Deltaproteobacteria bacterium]|nr:hypothetical protein [Deltaproteobacteria bacterium]